MTAAVVGAVFLGSVGGWYLTDAAKDRNPYALVVGLLFVGMSWVILLGSSQ